MIEIIIIELGCFLVALVSSILCWKKYCSPEMVEIFGPVFTVDEGHRSDENKTAGNTGEKKPGVDPQKMLKIRQQAGFASEVTRTAMVTILSVVGLPFYISTVSLRSVYEDRIFQLALLAVVLLSIAWNFYLGPRAFAIRHAGKFKLFSRDYFYKYTRPYMVWALYPVAVWGGIGLLALFMIVNSITIDLGYLNKSLSLLNGGPIIDLLGIQTAALRLVHFGAWISTVSQKYFITCVLAFIYVIVEQKSSMRFTILNSSIDRLKTAVWIGLILTIGFALVYLPANFERSHLMLNRVLEASLTQPLAGAEDLSDLISLQQYLEDHDIRWLLVSIVTGYGNVVSFIIIGLAVFLWRTYLKDFPLQGLIQLALPEYLIKAVKNFSSEFWIDPRYKKSKS